jgi:hypothetical protein
LGGGTGVQRRVGYFDDGNGLFFEDNAGTIRVVIRSSDSGVPVDTAVDQASWNMDAMDGSGPSGLTIDWANAQIFVLDFQWLSVGRVRFGLEVAGVIIYVHEHSVANVANFPWTSTPNLPIRYQIITTAASPQSSMRVICSSVISEGLGLNDLGITRAHANDTFINANIITDVYAILGVRLKATALGCSIEPLRATMMSITNDDVEWRLILNPTVAGTFTFTPLADSCVDIATGDSVNNPSTNTATGGTIIDRGLSPHQGSIDSRLLSALVAGSNIAGVADTLVLACRPVSASADVHGSLTWRERF